MDDSSASLEQQAINAALSDNWDEALRINQEIINCNPESADTLNRLARAYFETGDLKSSKKYYQQSLKLDPYNQIAYKFLKRIETCDKKGLNNKHKCPVSASLYQNKAISMADLFIEEPGKTKLINLIKVAEPKRLSLLSAGQTVKLAVKNRYIAATDQNDEYLGVLPDDLSHNLTRLIHGGNKYQALIKTVKSNSITLLIRETYRCARFKNQPSFLDSNNIPLSYSSNHLVVSEDSDAEITDDSEGDEEVT